jgi:hypothetical protein
MTLRYIAVLSLGLLVAGCGSAAVAPTSAPPFTASAPPPSSTSSAPASVVPAPASTPPSEYYLAAASGVDAAYAQWTTAIVGLDQPSQFVAPATTYAGALTTFDNDIADIGATGTAASDIAILVSDDQIVISDLEKVGNESAAELPEWQAQLVADGDTAITEGDIVRADLGLPAS